MKNISMLRAADYRNVVLQDSHWKRQLDDTMEFYLSISDDSLLYPFRKKAGLPAPGRPLEGWYGNGAHSFGQKLAAFARAYTLTGDGRFREKALYLTGQWIACVEVNPELLNQGTYVFDKLIGGLIEVAEQLNYPRALEYVEKLTDVAMNRFKRDVPDDGIQDERLWKHGMIEWYTLPENLLRAWQLTGKEKFREFALVWDYHYMWDHALAGDFAIGGRHAYSHINALSSAARLYEATGEKKYLDAMIAIYDEVAAHQCYATGGYGPAETLYAKKASYLSDAIKPNWDNPDPQYDSFAAMPKVRDDRWGSCEVSCCAWAVFKACNYLLQYTGDARFGAWAELLLINGTGGQPPITKDGKVMYYANYFLDGAIKTTEDRRLNADGSNFHWQCCTGTFPQDVVEYGNMLYYFDDGGVYVSQYLPSTMRFRALGREVTLTNCSRYPEESRVKFLVQTADTARFTLRFRVPSWCDHVSVMINGQAETVEAKPDTWGVIDRLWTDGDTVSIDFPFRLHFTPVDSHNPDIAALSYGPVVLVADEIALFKGDIAAPETWIRPVKDEPMAFETLPGHVGGYDFITRKFTPYYRVGEMKWYYMYNRVLPE